MCTTPVGFSDHNSVVLQFVGLGLGGEQPARWKFPLDALQDPETVDWVSQERQALEDDVAAWLVVDYSKAYDSVSHPMMAALFRYISIPAPRITVLLQILRGPVLFLVMGGGSCGNIP